MQYRITDPAVYGIAVFIFVMLILLYARPKCMFDESGQMRSFGDTWLTAVTLGVVAGVLGYFIYYGR
jgi:hypothetical protein